ncbi:uncharacterized protein LOC126266558 [Aethina tumida]|uniref:uncharacterized protein LOC126266558 n=1 Tax=Aethina tumida TaxID=116153 RepID=UPI002148A89F|nr:uncharacterized protein LOC126266558 [Aethina tumida]
MLIKPINNLPDIIDTLVENGYTFQVDADDSSVLRENFLSSDLPMYKQVAKMLNNNLKFCASIRYALNTKAAVIDEETALQYKVYKFCNLTLSERANLRLVTQNVFPGGYHAWSMQEATPYRGIFSKTIGRLNDAGLLAHWYQAASVFKIPKSDAEDIPTTEPLNILRLLPSFVFLIFGWLISVLLLFIEILWYYKKKSI